MKITKGKNSIDKGRYPVKVVYQPLTKLVGRLKDKSSKIIYVDNKQLRDTQKGMNCDVKNSKLEGE